MKDRTGSATKTVKYNKENSVKRLLGTGFPRKSIGFLIGLNISHCKILFKLFMNLLNLHR